MAYWETKRELRWEGMVKVTRHKMRRGKDSSKNEIKKTKVHYERL